LSSNIKIKPHIAIRKARAEDGNAILECLAAAFAEYRDQYSILAFADTVLDAESVERRLAEMVVFVAIGDLRVAGTIGCSVHGVEGHLRGMAVRPEWQGMGVASALLAAAETELEKCGCSYVTLDTTGPLIRAMRFYEKRGFRPTGKVSDFYGMRLLHYRKELPGPNGGDR
jgi:ribosomal protein S18 acetylase RimI-like enzyme